MTKHKTQIEKIEDHLEEYGAISNFFAIQTKLSLRLGARIFDLKERGWDFRTEELPNKNTVYHVTKWREGKYPKGERAKQTQPEQEKEFDLVAYFNSQPDYQPTN